jgi:hypothetical protein
MEQSRRRAAMADPGTTEPEDKEFKAQVDAVTTACYSQSLPLVPLLVKGRSA